MEGILVPLGFFAMVAAIVIVPRYLKSLERQKLQDTLRASIEKGAELPPEVVQAFSALGAGSNVIWVDPEQDVVAVLRWINGAQTDGFIDRLVAARA